MLAEAIIKRVNDRAAALDTAKADALTNLSDASGAGMPSAEDLAKWVNRIAELEGEREYLIGFLQVAAGKSEHQPEYWYMLQSARKAQGADDEWSGRANDVRRAKYDGWLKAQQEVFNLITR